MRRRHHHRIERSQKWSVTAILGLDAQGDQGRLVAALARARRRVNLEGAPSAEEEHIHQGGEVGQGVEKAGRPEAVDESGSLQR